MTDAEAKILKELQNISFMLGDLNAIRKGEYDPPKGADPAAQHHRQPRATTEDVYHQLTSVVGLLEQQNKMLYLIGEHLAGDSWAPYD